MTEPCHTFWGTHGCELPRGHDPEQAHPIHECSAILLGGSGEVTERGLCSQAQYVNESQIRRRYYREDGTWTDWKMSNVGLFRLDEEAVR